MLSDPLYAVIVKHPEVTCLIVFDEQFYNMSLTVILSHRSRLLQPIDNMAYCVGVASLGRPDLFSDLAVAFHQCGVESVRYGGRVITCFLLLSLIEVFCFLLADPFVEVTGGCLHQILPIGFVDAFGQNLRVEDDGYQFVA